MHWKWLLSTPVEVSLLLTIIIAILQLETVLGLRIYTQRSELMSLLGDENPNEDRLYLDHCKQSSRSGNCEMAIDDLVLREWTQCASTSEEHKGWWKAELETPSYISRVVIHTSELPDEQMRNALHDFVLMVGDNACHRHISSVPFISRSFPCDSFGDHLMVQSFRTNAILTLCEVEAYGKTVQFLGMDGGETELGFSGCLENDEIIDLEKCRAPIDRNFHIFSGVNGKQCLLTKPGLDKRPDYWLPSWWVVYMEVPALIKHVKIFNLMDSCCKNYMNKFYIKVNEVKCAAHESQTPFPTKIFACSRFGSNVKVENQSPNTSLALCQVQVFGYRMLIVPQIDHRVLGCFKDNPDDPDMEVLVSYSFMIPLKCHRMCKRINKLYFGLQNGQACMCSNKYGRYGRVDTSYCNLGCVSNDRLSCGGRNHTLVFEILR